jgi:uncharacterized protein (DUF2267 family)
MPYPHGFELTLQHSQQWLDDVLDELRTDDRELAYAALRAVLHALRDRLPDAEVVDLAAQLPMLIRGMFYEGWTLGERPASLRTKDGFLRHVQRSMKRQDLPAADAVRAVFAVVARRIAAGEIRDVMGTLPAEFDALWPVAAGRAEH